MNEVSPKSTPFANGSGPNVIRSSSSTFVQEEHSGPPSSQPVPEASGRLSISVNETDMMELETMAADLVEEVNQVVSKQAPNAPAQGKEIKRSADDKVPQLPTMGEAPDPNHLSIQASQQMDIDDSVSAPQPYEESLPLPNSMNQPQLPHPELANDRASEASIAPISSAPEVKMVEALSPSPIPATISDLSANHLSKTSDQPSPSNLLMSRSDVNALQKILDSATCGAPSTVQTITTPNSATLAAPTPATEVRSETPVLTKFLPATTLMPVTEIPLTGVKVSPPPRVADAEAVIHHDPTERASFLTSTNPIPSTASKVPVENPTTSMKSSVTSDELARSRIVASLAPQLIPSGSTLPVSQGLPPISANVSAPSISQASPPIPSIVSTPVLIQAPPRTSSNVSTPVVSQAPSRTASNVPAPVIIQGLPPAYSKSTVPPVIQVPSPASASIPVPPVIPSPTASNIAYSSIPNPSTPVPAKITAPTSSDWNINPSLVPSPQPGSSSSRNEVLPVKMMMTLEEQMNMAIEQQQRARDSHQLSSIARKGDGVEVNQTNDGAPSSSLTSSTRPMMMEMDPQLKPSSSSIHPSMVMIPTPSQALNIEAASGAGSGGGDGGEAVSPTMISIDPAIQASLPTKRD